MISFDDADIKGTKLKMEGENGLQRSIQDASPVGMKQRSPSETKREQELDCDSTCDTVT
jgi:hypothetical protein